jgi:hypothetical protein
MGLGLLNHPCRFQLCDLVRSIARRLQNRITVFAEFGRGGAALAVEAGVLAGLRHVSQRQIAVPT